MTSVRIYHEYLDADRDFVHEQLWAGWWDGEDFFPTHPPIDAQQERNLRWHLRENRVSMLIDEDMGFTAQPFPTARELLGLPEGEITREDVQLAATLTQQRLSQAVAEVLAECPPDLLRQNDLLDAAFA